MGAAQHVDTTAVPAAPQAVLIQTVVWPLLPAAGGHSAGPATA